jgi:hypothetical protein
VVLDNELGVFIAVLKEFEVGSGIELVVEAALDCVLGVIPDVLTEGEVEDGFESDFEADESTEAHCA